MAIMSMDPERLLKLRGFLDRGVRGYLSHKEGVELLAARDDLAREVERLNERLRIGPATVKGHQPADVLEHCCEVLGVRVEEHAWESTVEAFVSWLGPCTCDDEAERLRGERDHAQHEALRWAAKDHVGQRHPGEAAVKREAAREAKRRGWDHLEFEGECPGCRGVGGSEECGDCEVCKGRGKVGGQP